MLSKVHLYTQRGWPNDVNPELKPYVTRAHSGCLLWGMRVVIPDLCQDILRELHTSLAGIVVKRIHIYGHCNCVM